MTHFRRILFAIILFLFAGLLYKQWRDRQSEKGLFGLLEASKAETPAQSSAPPPSPGTAATPSILATWDREIADLAQKVLPCVVSIDTASIKEHAPSSEGRRVDIVPGLGSGVFISKEGHILTNNHVIEGTEEIHIYTNNEKLYKAQVIGTDPKVDIAVLKVLDANEEFPVLKFGDSSKVRVGQLVFAVGNPFGLSGSFTQGIISAAQRRMSDRPIHLLQTDTVINPGNSGGPLVNTRGEIVGINYSIYPREEKNQAWQGIGLAIAANDAKPVMEILLKNAPSSRPALLGITVKEEIVQLGAGQIGITINEVVPHSSAADAGLQKGDVIVGVNGKNLEHPEEVVVVANRTKVGEILKLDLLRRGEKISFTIRMQPSPED